MCLLLLLLIIVCVCIVCVLCVCCSLPHTICVWLFHRPVRWLTWGWTHSVRIIIFPRERGCYAIQFCSGVYLCILRFFGSSPFICVRRTVDAGRLVMVYRVAYGIYGFAHGRGRDRTSSPPFSPVLLPGSTVLLPPFPLVCILWTLPLLLFYLLLLVMKTNGRIVIGQTLLTGLRSTLFWRIRRFRDVVTFGSFVVLPLPVVYATHTLSLPTYTRCGIFGCFLAVRYWLLCMVL